MTMCYESCRGIDGMLSSLSLLWEKGEYSVQYSVRLPMQALSPTS